MLNFVMVQRTNDLAQTDSQPSTVGVLRCCKNDSETPQPRSISRPGYANSEHTMRLALVNTRWQYVSDACKLASLRDARLGAVM